jgi:hypothetical protein
MELNWQSWRRLPETEAFFEELRHMRGEVMEAWAAGEYVGPTIDATLQWNIKALGQVQLLNNIMEVGNE